MFKDLIYVTLINHIVLGEFLAAATVMIDLGVMNPANSQSSSSVVTGTNFSERNDGGKLVQHSTHTR